MAPKATLIYIDAAAYILRLVSASRHMLITVRPGPKWSQLAVRPSVRPPSPLREFDSSVGGGRN